MAPGAPGDIAGIELTGQPFFVQSSSYLAGDASLTIDTKWGGAKHSSRGEGLVCAVGPRAGSALVSSFGAIHRKRLQPGERYVVDTGHLVAWEGSTQYTLRKAASGFFRSMMSGEGIVAEFMGPGELLIQTRNLAALAGLLEAFLPESGRRRWRLQPGWVSHCRLSMPDHISLERTKAVSLELPIKRKTKARRTRSRKSVSILGVPLGYGAQHGRRRYGTGGAARRWSESAHRESGISVFATSVIFDSSDLK